LIIEFLLISKTIDVVVAVVVVVVGEVAKIS